MALLGATLIRNIHKSSAIRFAGSAILPKKSITPARSVSNGGQLQFGFQFVREYSKGSKMSTLPRVFFDMTADGEPVGRIIMEVSFQKHTYFSSIFILPGIFFCIYALSKFVRVCVCVHTYTYTHACRISIIHVCK